MRTDDFFDGDADIEQAELEAAGRAAGRGHRAMLRLRTAGNLAAAALACHHGAGYPTHSPAATNCADPRAGERGHRCTECGSFWTAEQIAPFYSRLYGVQLSALRQIAPLVPCELEPR
ncbi:MAG: hypothetical protein WBC51_03725 [Vicinamibacterales bacterium]